MKLKNNKDNPLKKRSGRPKSMDTLSNPIPVKLYREDIEAINKLLPQSKSKAKSTFIRLSVNRTIGDLKNGGIQNDNYLKHW